MRSEGRTRVASAVASLFTCLLLVLSGCLGGGGSGSVLYDVEKDIPQQNVASFPLKLKRGMAIHLEAVLQVGRRADFLFMNASDLPKYLDPGNVTYDWVESCSALNTGGINGDCGIQWDNDYYFVVDNTQRPINGANPEPSVKVRVLIKSL